MPRYDKLGRKIPEFDRSAAGKKGAQTRLKKDPDFYSKIGYRGGKAHGRGYLGKLKEENPEELARVQAKGKEARSRSTN